MMPNRTFTNGLIILAAGLLASSVSSLLEIFSLFGSGTNFVRGFFDGLAVVAFCGAIYLMVRSRTETKG